MKKHTLLSLSTLKSVKTLDKNQKNVFIGGRRGEGFIPPPSNTATSDDEVVIGSRKSGRYSYTR
ncbi:MAG: hypothetical protein AB8B69_17905 [Chitinophagales bacterium]